MPIVLFVAALALIGVLVTLGLIALVAGGTVFGVGYLIYKGIQSENRTAAYKAQVKETRELEWRNYTDTVARLTPQVAHPIPTDEEFLDMLGRRAETALAAQALEAPDPEVLDRILMVAKNTYGALRPSFSFPPVPPAPTPRQDLSYSHKEYMQRLSALAPLATSFNPNIIAEPFVTVIARFAALHAKLPKSGQFEMPLHEAISRGDLVSLLHDITRPFSGSPFTNLPLWASYIGNARSVGDGDPVFPQDFKGSNADMVRFYMSGHPFKPLLEIPAYLQLDDETRYRHHWCVGEPGSGKTTYLSHLILNDIPAIVRNECSLVLMDSQRLAKQISHLKHFAPSQPLHGRLILVDPDPRYALALNPFLIPGLNINQKIDILTYALSALTTDDTSGLQKGALGFLIRAVAHKPDANLNDLREFFRINDKNQYIRDFPFPDVWDRLPTTLQDYFTDTWPMVAQATKQALQIRLANFLQDPIIEKMICAPECRLDLHDVLQRGGKIILIDTDQNKLGPDLREIFGRIFIALLDQIASRRGGVPEKSLKGVFIMYDEAHDYIESDERFASMLVKARNKRMAITVSNHRAGQIKNSDTRESLEGSMIRTQCVDAGYPVTMKVGRPPNVRTYEFIPARLDWTEEPQMKPAEYHAVRQEIFEAYGPRHDDTAPATEPADDPHATR